MSFENDFDDAPISNLFETCVYLLTDALEASPDLRDALLIGLLRLRLTRWGEAVNIRNEASFGHDIDPEDIDAVRETLVQMIGVFKRDSGSDNHAFPRQRPRQQWLAQSPFLEFARITFDRCGELKDSLVNGLLGYEDRRSLRMALPCIGELETILPATQRQRDLFAAEKLMFTEEWIRSLRTLGSPIDPWWAEALSAGDFFVDTGDFVRLIQENK